MTLPKPYAGPAPVFVNEVDAGCLKRASKHRQASLNAIPQRHPQKPNCSDPDAGSVREFLARPVEESSGRPVIGKG